MKQQISWEVEIPTITGEHIKFKIDTGADVTIIHESELYKLNIKREDVKRTSKKLIGPSGEKLKCLGYIVTKFKW